MTASLSAEFLKVKSDFESELSSIKNPANVRGLLSNYLSLDHGYASIADIQWMLEQLKAKRLIKFWRLVTWDRGAEVNRAGPVIAIQGLNRDDHWVIDSLDSPDRVEPTEDWLAGIYERELDRYLEIEPPEFWASDPGVYYHGTKKENVESIKRDGLEPRSDTRAIRNRHVGPAVFLTPDVNGAAHDYGPAVFAVDMSAMRRDKVMPRVEREAGVDEAEIKAAIAHKLGYEDYSPDRGDSEGISDDTLVVHGTIPPKYLRLLDGSEVDESCNPSLDTLLERLEALHESELPQGDPLSGNQHPDTLNQLQALLETTDGDIYLFRGVGGLPPKGFNQDLGYFWSENPAYALNYAKTDLLAAKLPRAEFDAFVASRDVHEAGPELAWFFKSPEAREWIKNHTRRVTAQERQRLEAKVKHEVSIGGMPPLMMIRHPKSTAELNALVKAMMG